ncbi:MAG: hypothetical protein LUH18_04245 [Oscillospiraceae bacterium]|nr:hypothetical protein [Oscillospiraceae bacterium]
MKLLKRNKSAKRLLCLLLSALMIMSALPVGMVADETSVTTVSVGDIVTVSGIKYTVVATDTDGTNSTYGGNNTGTGAWLTNDSTALSNLTTEGALIYVEYTSTGARYSTNVGLQFSTTGSPQVGYRNSSDYSTAMFVTSSELTYTTFSLATIISKATAAGYSMDDCYQIYSYLGNGTETYIYSVSVIVPYVDESKTLVCTDILSASNMGNYSDATTNDDGSMTAGTNTQWLTYKLDNTYADGDTVTIHISGTTTESQLRFYLSTASDGRKSGDYRITVNSDGSFDATVTMVATSDGSEYSSDATTYVSIKSTTYNPFTSLTITHLGVVDGEVSVASSVKHTINISDTTKGTVTASSTTAKSGEAITLTATPDSGYTLSALTVTNSRGNEIAVTNNTFSMPSSDVTVSATFTFSGDDDCGHTIAMNTSSVRSSYISKGDVTVVENTSINSSAEQFELKLPYTVTSTGTVTVHITGTSDADFRIWLANGYDQLSDAVKASDLGYSGSGAFDLTFELTFDDKTTKNYTSADYILFKGSGYGVNLNNLTLTHVGITYQPSFYGRALTLDGEIGVTYYFSMDGVTNPEAYSLVATVGGVKAETVHAANKTIGGVTYYRYTVYVSVADINSTISAYLTDGTTTVSVSDYSVATYCTEAASVSDKESALCQALLTYGYYTGVLINETTDITGYTEASTITVNIDAVEYGSTETTGVAKTLALDSTISIRMYLTSDVASGAMFTVNGNELTVNETTDSYKSDYPYYIEFKVSARNLDTMYTVYKNGEEFTKYSVYTYIMNNYQDTETTELADLCKAIYNYSLRAEDYDGWV